MSEKYDIVVAGAGHNGLVTACYLAKAGLKVCVVERSDKVGGGVMNRQFGPNGDFTYDVCSVAHIMIQPNPLILNDELGLMSKFGLKYLRPEKMSSCFFMDDGRTLDFYTDYEKTAQSIAKFSERDAVAYRKFIKDTDQTLDLLVMGMYNTSPTYGHQAMLMDQSPAGQELLRIMSMSAWDMICEYFESDAIRICMARYTTEAMFNPFDNGTGFGFFMNLPIMHRYGCGIPVGGAGALADSLVKCLESHGGVIKTNSPIKQFMMSGQKAVGVITESGEQIEAKRAVISNLHAQQMFPHMVPGADLPEYFQKRVSTAKLAPYAPFNMHLALHETPIWKSGPPKDEFWMVESAHTDLDAFRKCCYDLANGIPRRDFVSYVTCDCVDKGTRSPEGTRVFQMYALNTYNLKDGGAKKWDEIGKRVAYEYLDDLKSMTTNMTDDNIIDYVWYTPLDIERHNPAFIQGDIQHIAPYNWQLGGNRPCPGYGQYKSPIDQLYMTGASTHPGGAVTAASGRNAARVVMDDFGMDFDKLVTR